MERQPLYRCLSCGRHTADPFDIALEECDECGGQLHQLTPAKNWRARAARATEQQTLDQDLTKRTFRDPSHRPTPTYYSKPYQRKGRYGHSRR